MDKTTRNLIIIAGILALGGLGYWIFSRRSKQKGLIKGITDLKGDDEYFTIYVKTNVQPSDIVNANNKWISGADPKDWGYPNGAYPNNSDFQVGDKIAITNGGNLNGQYVIQKRWHKTGDKNALLKLNLLRGKYNGLDTINADLKEKGGYSLYLNEKQVPKWRLIDKVKTT